VRRNRERFPADFMFQLSIGEHAALRSQIATPIAAQVAAVDGISPLPSPSTGRSWRRPSSTVPVRLR
jgi:hypothetical protein